MKKTVNLFKRKFPVKFLYAGLVQRQRCLLLLLICSLQDLALLQVHVSGSMVVHLMPVAAGGKFSPQKTIILTMVFTEARRHKFFPIFKINNSLNYSSRYF